MATIDLNADLGEGGEYDAALLALVSSCNIACGGHAGDEHSMAETVRIALEHGVAIGAHPSYPDRDGFGRTSGFLSGDALYESLTGQVTALVDIAGELGARLTHLKPHGALYNDAAADADLADICARVAVETPGDVSLVGLPGSALQAAAANNGIGFVGEAFVDRAYTADGRLVPRSEAGAVYTDIDAMTAQALSLARDRCVQAMSGERVAVAADTLCIHGDTPGAAAAARAVRAALEAHGIEIRAP